MPQSEKKIEEQLHKSEQKKAKKEIEKIVCKQNENNQVFQSKESLIKQLEKKMNDAVKTLDFLQAAVYRDEIKKLKNQN